MNKVIITTAAELETLIQQSIRKALFEERDQNQRGQEDEILTITEAATFLKTAKQTIYGYTSKKLIPFIKKGKKILFRKAELKAWLSEGKQKSISELKKELEEGHE